MRRAFWGDFRHAEKNRTDAVIIAQQRCSRQSRNCQQTHRQNSTDVLLHPPGSRHEAQHADDLAVPVNNGRRHRQNTLARLRVLAEVILGSTVRTASAISGVSKADVVGIP